MEMGYLDMSTGMFRQVPIATFARINYTSTFTGINRKNFRRVVTLSSNVVEGYVANDIVKEINAIISNLELPEGYQVKMTGEQEDQQETSSFLGLAFLASLLLMYLIMSTQFNSFAKPFIIFSTVLFSLIGVFLGYAFSGQNFSIVMTGVGIFSLAGIVIRNGILLLEFTDELQHRGVPLKEAVVQAGATRATPVFLTAICAILSLYPLAVGLNLNFATLLEHGDPHFFLGGDNVVFWGPLAWTMIYGLVVATFLTLLVVPCLLLVYLGLRTRLFNLLGIKREKDAIDPSLAESGDSGHGGGH
jgi:multidrug efflux pump subunit AcrB